MSRVPRVDPLRAEDEYVRRALLAAQARARAGLLPDSEAPREGKA